MKIPILTYHTTDIVGVDYADNDLVALAADLEAVTAKGFEIVRLSRLVHLWTSDPDALRSRRLVAFTCDDGSDFDYHDILHPTAGPQRSMFNVLRDFRERHPGAQPDLAMTSFVIVSPEARMELDRTCLIGRQWWNDDWWAPAIASGLVEIASHSWDHNHGTLPPGQFPDIPRGAFTNIDTEDVADYQIAAAQDYLERKAPNPGLALFAYPYGETSPFLVEDYLPRRGESLGLRAAFTTDAEFVQDDSDRWSLPRFMSRRDWSSPAGLDEILAQAMD